MKAITELKNRGVVVHHDVFTKPEATPTVTPPVVTAPPQPSEPASGMGTVIFDTTPPGPRQAGDLFIDLVAITDPIRPDDDVEVQIKTLPGATCTIQPVNPKTGTRSSRPEDKVKVANEDGTVTWHWHVHRHVAPGDGRLELTAEFATQRIEKHYLWRIH
jgi:hypothetical protein